MNQISQDSVFAAVVNSLHERHGENCAITLDELAITAGLFKEVPAPDGRNIKKPVRRQIEHLMETRLIDIPFLVVSTSKGYFRPATPDEIEHCWASLQSRIKSLASRMHTLRRKAPSSGFRYTGNGKFQREFLHDLFENDRTKGVQHNALHLV